MYLLYSLLFTLGLIMMAPRYAWRYRGTIGLAAWKERFGFLPPSFRQAKPGAIWVHAVSVGETFTVAGLIRELQTRWPSRQIFLSHLTPSGREAGERRIPNISGRFYLPFDWAWSVRRAVNTLRPSLLLIAETELWPNLVRAARRSGCRVVVVNGRLSDRSFPRYFRIRRLMQRVLNEIDCLCVQSAADAKRFAKLGARPGKIMVTGNLKFDARPSQLGETAMRLREALASTKRGPVWIAASTMPKEEPLVLEAWREIRRCHSKALLVLAPRHPARFDEVAGLLASSGTTFVRRTALAASQDERTRQIKSVQALLLDSIGELAGMFELADLVFVGGTLVPTGGHNLLEPAFWARATVFGPHMENFRDAAELFLGAGAAVRVKCAGELGQVCSSLLENDSERSRLGGNARRVLDQHSGATSRTLNQIREWLDTDVPARAAS